MQAILDFIKSILPVPILKKIRPIGHGFLAFLAALRYGFPSNRMITVGVTGTAGKSTTIQMLAAILNQAGSKAGYITTISIFNGEHVHINQKGMSMPGRFELQNSLRRMADLGCRIAIIECTSEGLAQNRHVGINFDLAILTNLDRAHLDSHGSFENYRAAKGKLFAGLFGSARKDFFRKKIIGLNLDTADQYFLQFKADRKFAVSAEKDAPNRDKFQDYFLITDISEQSGSSKFKIHNQEFELHLPGLFNIYNAALAAAMAAELGISLDKAAAALSNFSGALGRMQLIANQKKLKIYVDYAPEPAGMRAALLSLQKLAHHRIIHVFGCTGGHRDIAKRFEFGEISAQFADLIFITNDDVYQSDPEKIADNIEAGIARVPKEKRRATEMRRILDRRQAIAAALAAATPEDLVIITGKGSEQFLILPGNKRIVWDDSKVVEEILA